MQQHLTRFRASTIFNIFAIGLIIITFLIYEEFKASQEDIIVLNQESNLAYVNSISNNLSEDLTRIINEDFYSVIKDDEILIDYIKSDLNLFITTKYHSISLIGKRDQKDEYFIYFVDGSKNSHNKKDFGEIFTLSDQEKLHKVYRDKKPLYFESNSEKNLGATYLYPIIVNNQIEAILTVVFSLDGQKTLLSILDELTKMFETSLTFFVLIFGFILLFSYADTKRERNKEKTQKKLERSNKKLAKRTEELKIEAQKVQELNATLEDKIHKEVSKNREKDKHILQQSRLAQMGEMISMIAHQWRQPLAAISATSASLNLKAQLGRADKETIIQKSQDIANYAQHLSTTIDDFRNFFKPNKEKQLTSYQELITAVIGIVGVSITNKNIRIVEDLQSQSLFETYANEIKQVLLNLIKNAEDVLYEKSIKDAQIYIHSYDSEKWAIIEVEDNGGGIDISIIDKIFNPYFSTKLEKNGAGLGLYMSKTIIEEHCKGKLTARNKPNGALFQIKLPKG